MTTEQLKDWLKQQIDVGQGIRIGGIDGNADRFIGVYPKPVNGSARICLGGAEQTLTKTKRFDILVHWTQSATAAEQKAAEVWQLFYNMKSGTEMEGAVVYVADPSEEPVPLGRDDREICEFLIQLTVTTRSD